VVHTESQLRVRHRATMAAEQHADSGRSRRLGNHHGHLTGFQRHIHVHPPRRAGHRRGDTGHCRQ